MSSNADIILREVEDGDLPTFFEHGRDPEAVRMAAFTAEDPADRANFDSHWAIIRSKDSVTLRTILFKGEVAGHVASFERGPDREVTYWIGREHWGKGIATEALSLFLQVDGIRPLYARAAKDNAGSIRVLEKCGFRQFGEDSGFANGRGARVEEYILELKG